MTTTTYPKTDDQLRAEIIRHDGTPDAIHELEIRLSRDAIRDRRDYRRELERLAYDRGIDRLEAIPSATRSSCPPYGALIGGRVEADPADDIPRS